MTLDILTASQGGTSAVFQTKRCIFLPERFSNGIRLMTHVKNEVPVLSRPLPSLPDPFRELVWF